MKTGSSVTISNPYYYYVVFVTELPMEVSCELRSAVIIVVPVPPPEGEDDDLEHAAARAAHTQILIIVRCCLRNLCAPFDLFLVIERGFYWQ